MEIVTTCINLFKIKKKEKKTTCINDAIITPKNINHFSHSHVLELSNTLVVQSHQEGQTTSTIPPKTLCSCCRFRPYGQIYICKPCNFFLHVSCSKSPNVITHPSHGNHSLTLHPAPQYPGGVFICNACNRKGDGFNYHCSSCKFDLHPVCAQKPPDFAHQFHSCTLKLFFEKPYESNFQCDICRESIGSNEWRYRCNSCDFDVHLECTRQVRYNGWLTAKKPASPVQRMVDGKKAQLQQQHQPTPQQ